MNFLENEYFQDIVSLFNIDEERLRFFSWVFVIVAILLCLYTATHGVLLLGSLPGSFKKEVGQVVQNRSDENQNNIKNIVSWHLFGNYQAVAVSALPPETSLNLVLTGVFRGNAKEDSHVVIEVPGEQSNSYSVGDSVPGGAKVYQIMEKSVILQRGSELETLPLKQSAPIFPDHIHGEK